MKLKTTISKNLQTLLWLSFCFFAMSCIPIKIAPNIQGAKIYNGRKFNKHLPKQHVYVFNDPKGANEFYTYLNVKFGMDYGAFGGNVPIIVGGENYYLTFYEVERKSKTVNLLPIMVDMVLYSKGDYPLPEAEIFRTGTWYIALTVSDVDLEDILKESHSARSAIIAYLDNLRIEYLSTTNYMDVYFRN